MKVNGFIHVKHKEDDYDDLFSTLSTLNGERQCGDLRARGEWSLADRVPRRGLGSGGPAVRSAFFCSRIPAARPAEGPAGGLGAWHAVPAPLGSLFHLWKLLLLFHAQSGAFSPGTLLLQVTHPESIHFSKLKSAYCLHMYQTYKGIENMFLTFSR